MKRVLPILLMLFALAPALLPAEEGVKISGYFFGDAYGFLSHQNPEVTGQTGVWIRRVYLTLDRNLGEFAVRLRFELNSPDSALAYKQGGATAASDSLKPYVKDLYLSYRLAEKHTLFAGIIPTPTWEKSEGEWEYRSVEKTPVDLAKWGSAREVGVSLLGEIGEGAVLYHLVLGNGNGLKSETDKGKVVQLALGTKALFEGFFLEAYGDYNDKPGIARDSFTLQGFARYRTSSLNLGAWYDFIREIGTPGRSTYIRLVSLYAILGEKGSTRFLLRGDRLFNANPKAKDIEYLRLSPTVPYTVLLAGVDFPLAPEVSLIPNLEGVLYEAPEQGERPKPVAVARLTLFVRF